jgi:hypothetical protein
LAAFGTDPGLAFQKALDFTEVTYNLGFYPQTMDGAYHSLEVRVARKKVEIESRRGYFAGSNTPTASSHMDISALAAAVKGSEAQAVAASMQLPYFYTLTGQARVYLAMEFSPAGMDFQSVNGKPQGRIDFVGTTSKPDGEAVGRFAESDTIDRETQPEADSFAQAVHRYEHQFLLTPGSYLFRMTIAAGPSATRQIEAPLNIERWKPTTPGMGSIAFSTESRATDAGRSTNGVRPLVAAGREFVPATRSHFGRDEHVYFYTEIYAPQLKGGSPANLLLEYRVVDRVTGKTVMDSGAAGVAGYVHPGDPLVPFATTLDVAKLEPGSYRLELRATCSGEGVGRNADFDLN